MRRRILATAGVVGALLAGAPSALAGPGLEGKRGCADFTDPAGDATVLAPQSVMGVTTPTDPNASAIDITGVAMRATPSVLAFHVTVPGLTADGPQRGTGDAWVATFTTNKHVVSLKVSRFLPVQDQDLDDLWDANNPTEWLNTVYVDDEDQHGATLVRGDYNVAKHLVVITVARESLETLVGPITEASVASVAVHPRAVYSTHDFLIVSGGPALERAAQPAKAVITVDENRCF